MASSKATRAERYQVSTLSITQASWEAEKGNTDETMRAKQNLDLPPSTTEASWEVGLENSTLQVLRAQRNSNQSLNATEAFREVDETAPSDNIRACDITKMSKKQTKKLKRKIMRAERQQQKKEATLTNMKVDGRAGPMNPFIITRKRDEATARAMQDSKREYHWTDPIFQDFFKVKGDKSKLLYFCEKPTRVEARRANEAFKVEFMVQVVLFEDMTVAERCDMQAICQHLKSDAVRKYKITSNAAQIGGIMKVIGWRAAYEHAWDFGTYASSPQTTKTMYRCDASDYNKTAGCDALRIHKIMAQHFHDMAPTLHQEAVQLAHSRQLPMLGETAEEWQHERATRQDLVVENTGVRADELYASNLTYTYSKTLLFDNMLCS